MCTPTAALCHQDKQTPRLGLIEFPGNSSLSMYFEVKEGVAIVVLWERGPDNTQWVLVSVATIYCNKTVILNDKTNHDKVDSNSHTGIP